MAEVDVPQVRVSADVRFSVEIPGHRPVTGTVTGSGNRLEVRVSDSAYFAGTSDVAPLRRLAATLAGQGITVAVFAGETVLLEMGDVQASWWQRRLTRSAHLRVASVRGGYTGLVGRMRGVGADAVLPGRELLPPQTLFPIAPTFGQIRRTVTTTHDRNRGGNPRLLLSTSNRRLPADGRIIFPLRGRATTIGSDLSCDICLDGLEPLHAEVLHDDNDELVLRDRSGAGTTLVNGAPARDGRVLRTGSRINVGDWVLAYRRAEYADHGRPYGGRVGGEAGHQRTQADPR